MTLVLIRCQGTTVQYESDIVNAVFRLFCALRSLDHISGVYMSKAYEEFDHLETERLTLRPFTEADYPLILRISSDPQTTEYLYYWGRIGTTPESDARRFLDYAVKNWKKTPEDSMV